MTNDKSTDPSPSRVSLAALSAVLGLNAAEARKLCSILQIDIKEDLSLSEAIMSSFFRSMKSTGLDAESSQIFLMNNKKGLLRELDSGSSCFVEVVDQRHARLSSRGPDGTKSESAFFDMKTATIGAPSNPPTVSWVLSSAGLAWHFNMRMEREREKAAKADTNIVGQPNAG